MKLLKTVPAAVMLAGSFATVGAMADDSVFTVMDDPSAAKKPFEGVVNARLPGAVRQHQRALR